MVTELQNQNFDTFLPELLRADIVIIACKFHMLGVLIQLQTVTNGFSCALEMSTYCKLEILLGQRYFLSCIFCSIYAVSVITGWVQMELRIQLRVLNSVLNYRSLSTFRTLVDTDCNVGQCVSFKITQFPLFVALIRMLFLTD